MYFILFIKMTCYLEVHYRLTNNKFGIVQNILQKYCPPKKIHLRSDPVLDVIILN